MNDRDPQQAGSRQPPFLMISVGLMLVLKLAVTASHAIAAPPTQLTKPTPQLEFLMSELRAESPFYYDWLGRSIGPNIARSRIAQHPAWNDLLSRLRKNSAPVRVFRHLLTGHDEGSRPYDLRHRRFALVGIAAGN